MMGKKTIGEAGTTPLRCTTEIVDKFIDDISNSSTASWNLQNVDVFNNFYDSEADFLKDLTKAQAEEAFYAVKTERFSTVIPSKYLFLLSKVKERYKTFNMLAVALRKTDINKLFKPGTIAEGYTLYDVICSAFEPAFKPVSENVQGVFIKDHWEVYDQTLNRIIFLPKDLGDIFSDNDFEEMCYSKDCNDIVCKGTPIRFLGGYKGVRKDTHDLRDLI